MNIRNILNITEGYVHGSEKELPIGTILKPNDYENRWKDSFIYTELEKYRPNQCLPHKQSVFMVQDDNIDDIYHAGGPREGFLFKLEPIGKIEKHNLAWIDQLVEYIQENEKENKKYVAKLVMNYWLGIMHPDAPDTYEYVVPSARIIAVSKYSI